MLWNNNYYKNRNRVIFVWPRRMVSVSVSQGGGAFLICFIGQLWTKRSKHGLLVFPPKKIPIWRRHCSIGQSCCTMTSKRSISWFLQSSLGMKFFHLSICLPYQKPRAFVSIQWTNQIVLFLFVCCFCFGRAFSFQGHKKIALRSKCSTTQVEPWAAGKWYKVH